MRLTAAAETDFHAIVLWSAQQFDDRQARIYATTNSRALEALVDGPHQIGVRLRPDIGMGLVTLHVGANRSKGAALPSCSSVRKRALHRNASKNFGCCMTRSTCRGIVLLKI